LAAPDWRSATKVTDLRSKIRRIFPNANYSNLPLLWQPAVKDATAAKRNKWQGPVRRRPPDGKDAVYAGFAYP